MTPALGVLLLALLAGCTSNSVTRTTITNLTPSAMERNEDGLYLLECMWQSNQQSIREGSLRAWVMVGSEFHPMQRTPMMKDRWEALVPVPQDQNTLHYRFKFEYLYNRIPDPARDSKLSAPSRLDILNP